MVFPTAFLPHLQLCHFAVHARPAVTSAVKANPHMPCRSPDALIHTCHAVTLPCSDSAVSFVKVRVVHGNIRTTSPATTLYKRCLVSHWPPASEVGTLLVTTFVKLRVVAGRSRKRAGRQHAVSGRPMLIHTYHAVPMPRCAVALRSRFQKGMVVAWHGNDTGAACERHGNGMVRVN
jgi:hypothetical protein